MMPYDRIIPKRAVKLQVFLRAAMSPKAVCLDLCVTVGCWDWSGSAGGVVNRRCEKAVWVYAFGGRYRMQLIVVWVAPHAPVNSYLPTMSQEAVRRWRVSVPLASQALI